MPTDVGVANTRTRSGAPVAGRRQVQYSNAAMLEAVAIVVSRLRIILISFTQIGLTSRLTSASVGEVMLSCYRCDTEVSFMGGSRLPVVVQ